MNILILGCGQIGQALAIQLQQQGHQVTAVSRSPKQITDVRHLCQDIHQLQLDRKDAYDWVYVIVTPQQRSVDNYQSIFVDSARPVFQALQDHPVQHIVFISSTRVYGEDKGQWIDDHTHPQTSDPIGQCLIAAEQLWSAYWQERLIIIRPSGLYQGDSPYLTRMACNTTEISSRHWTNRVHRKDLVGFLAFLLHADSLQASYLLSDQQPTLQHQIINTIRQREGLAPLVLSAHLPETGKRVIATHLMQSGYVMQYPRDERFNLSDQY